MLKKQERLACTAEKKFFSVDETAEVTGFKPWTIRQACNKGRIKGRKGDDGRWRVPHDEVLRLQEEGLPAE
jgi:predicted site-specific integrase-resolvase